MKNKDRWTWYIPALCGMIVGGAVWISLCKGRCREIKVRADRFESFLDLITKWVCLREIDRSLVPLLKDEGIQNVAIYGMRTLGRCVMDELAGSEIAVLYAIDAGAENIYSHIPVIAPDDDYPPVDAIIVTSVQNFADVRESVQRKTNARILNLSELVDNGYFGEFVQ